MSRASRASALRAVLDEAQEGLERPQSYEGSARREVARLGIDPDTRAGRRRVARITRGETWTATDESLEQSITSTPQSPLTYTTAERLNQLMDQQPTPGRLANEVMAMLDGRSKRVWKRTGPNRGYWETRTTTARKRAAGGRSSAS